MEIFGLFGKYYYLVLILQAICVFHCIRKGNQQNWIWLIVFLPAIGCLIYLFTEIITRREVSMAQDNLSKIVVPSGRLKKLKQQVDFSPTFQNKVNLADEYMNAGMTDDAIALYEQSLEGMFAENPDVLMKLMEAYSDKNDYARVAALATPILKHPDFVKQHAHVLYAIALEQLGRKTEAEMEFLAMKGRFSGFEARYSYACFLMREHRMEEAEKVLNAIVSEASHMSPGETRNHRTWIRLAKEALNRKAVPGQNLPA